MTVNNELIDRLLADYKKPEDLIGENGFSSNRPSDWSNVPLKPSCLLHRGKSKPMQQATCKPRAWPAMQRPSR